MRKFFPKKNFIKLSIFLLFIFATLNIFFLNTSFYAASIALIWSGFGLIRILELLPDTGHKSHYTGLTTRILKGIKREEYQKGEFILQRFLKKDFIMWSLSFTLLIGWTLWCSFFPYTINLLKNINTTLHGLLDDFHPIITPDKINYHAITTSLSFIFMAMIISFITLSYTHSRASTHFLLLILGCPFMLLTAYIFYDINRIPSPFIADLTILKGAGLGQANVIFAINPQMKADSSSFLAYRFIETGTIGAYGFYLLYIIPLLNILKYSRIKNPTSLWFTLFSIVPFITTALLDIYWPMQPQTLASITLAALIIITCWGHIGFYRSTSYSSKY